MVVLSLP
jgi:hypothetical protein